MTEDAHWIHSQMHLNDTYNEVQSQVPVHPKTEMMMKHMCYLFVVDVIDLCGKVLHMVRDGRAISHSLVSRGLEVPKMQLHPKKSHGNRISPENM